MTTRKRVSPSHVRPSAHAWALAFLLCLCVASPPPAAAQLIPIRTVPLADGDQFNFYPSSNAGMAGIGIALPDTLLDPFLNPAKGARLRQTQFFGMPSFYDVSKRAGGGRTLPLGALFHSGSTFAGLLLAIQEVSPARRDNNNFPPPPIFVANQSSLVATDLIPVGATSPSRQNRYVFATIGRELGRSGLSIAGSVQWDGLNAIDGTDLLYAGNQGLVQHGDAVDVRLGLLKQWKGDRSFEALLLHNRFGMTHDVSYLDLVWDPNQRTTVTRARTEHNLDRTNTWGAQLGYMLPVGDSGLRLGFVATTNLLSHPKIPDYQFDQVMLLPRDPGHSAAYDFGVGVSRTNNLTTGSIEAVFEPIVSHTWAQADAPTQTSSGATIAAGDKTIENHFRFANAVLRTGVSQEWRFTGSDASARLQLGIGLRSVRYWGDQYDHVQQEGRGFEQHWLEWNPTWGLSLRFPELELRYQGRTTSGTGRPGVATSGQVITPSALADASSGRAILAVPDGPTVLDPVRVTTHQISVSLPIH